MANKRKSLSERERLIKKYEKLMYKYGEYDIWEDDIEPKLASMTVEEIKKWYEEDKEYYQGREAAGGYWG